MSTPTSTMPTDTAAPAASQPSRTIPNVAFAGVRRVPQPTNDPNRSYAPGSPERAELKARLKAMAAEKIDIPIVIGGKEIRTGKLGHSIMPHDHKHVLADYHLAGPEHIQQAIAAAAAARREWGSWPWEERAGVLLRAAELLATTWRSTLNAATMLGQSKTAYQAEIDSASEMIDFWRFSAWFARLYEQPMAAGVAIRWNTGRSRASSTRLAVQPRRSVAPTTGPGALGSTVTGGVERDAGRLLHARARGRRPAAGVNFVPGDARRLPAPSIRGVRRRPLHRQHQSLQQHVEGRRTSAATRLIARGRRNQRRGLRRRPSVGESVAVAVAIARGGRVLRDEVLGREPRLRAAVVWSTCASTRSMIREMRSATSPPATSPR